MSTPASVNSVSSGKLFSVALARPKSMIFGTASPSRCITRMLEGFKSRWITPFWCACCTAFATCRNSPSRWRVSRQWWSQYSVMGIPGTYSMTK